MLLGIRESEAKPPVAAKIVPIQRCADLAERLKLVFRDRVEPQLPRIDIFAVSDRGRKWCCYLFRVGRSRLAPHRVKKITHLPDPESRPMRGNVDEGNPGHDTERVAGT